MPSVILTRPVNGSGSSVPGSVVTNITIPPSNTVVVDSCPWTLSASVKWIYTLMDAIASQTLTAEVLATHRNGLNPTHNRFAVIGDNVLHQASVGIFTGDIGLQITNNGPNTLVVNIVRIQVLS